MLSYTEQQRQRISLLYSNKWFFFWGSTFRIKHTKVPLLLEAICYSGETGQKSSGGKCLRKLWASKLPHTISSQLIKFSRNRQFLKILVLNEQSFINYLPRKKISGERRRVGGKKSVTDFRFTVDLREMYFRQTERNFTGPYYTCLKCLQVTSGVFTVWEW